MIPPCIIGLGKLNRSKPTRACGFAIRARMFFVSHNGVTATTTLTRTLQTIYVAIDVDAHTCILYVHQPLPFHAHNVRALEAFSLRKKMSQFIKEFSYSCTEAERLLNLDYLRLFMSMYSKKLNRPRKKSERKKENES